MEVLNLIFDDAGVESEFSDDGVVKSEFSDHRALSKFTDSSAVKYYFGEKNVRPSDPILQSRSCNPITSPCQTGSDSLI